ncbi:glycan 1-3-beta-glucosidase precursor [Apiospora aurea]|uniref:Glycan 1-3-beta-glucosidase n=1 Tax=Apiospora aurea TaxID=335848 RepID=A0ABR1QL85_9PEZI
MVDHQHNYFNASPDKGTRDGAVWQYSGSFENFMTNLRAGNVIRGGDGSGVKPGDNATSASTNSTLANSAHALRSDSSSYWLTKLGPLGSQPLAGSGYKFFRNVVDDYHADSSGATDTTESINAAIQDGSRCGKECGNTFTKGAIIYFPPGTYKTCSPIIQLYYTQFIGDPNDPPTIKGCDTFKGIALIDTDPYIPGTYINENQFFRHIRNFIFDLTDMPLSTTDNGQPYVPTGIHWQAAQATTLQNLVFNMPNATDVNTASHVGIFMENGSGGFVSDLVEINGGAIGFNISGRGGDKGQGTGSVSIIDSPNIVLDNLWVTNVTDIVAQDDHQTLLSEGPGPYNVELWAAGKRYTADEGSYKAGPADAPPKGYGLTDDNGKLFVRSRPQYEELDSSSFLVATNEGISNDGSGDQAGAINAFLAKAASSNQVAYFPAGIYQIGSTVLIPTGSRVQGSSWSQIQGAGFYFADMHDPKVMVQVGNKGDVGNIEIVEMLFSVAGPTAGAILMEWNVAAAHQGSAAMWDSHFRVGGATGTDLDVEHCPKSGGLSAQCIAASLVFHVTQQASGYFENVWAWVADHDNDFSTASLTDKTAGQVSVYGARGMLVESEGPSWFYGSGSEHSVLYNYQFYNARNIYIGHLQTETPYFQPEPVAPAPFSQGKSFAGDPAFDHCTTDTCRMSWGLRIIDCNNVTVHGAGLYSFFNNYDQDCVDTHNCQERILEVQGSVSIVVFNLFTVATTDIAFGVDNTAIHQNDTQSLEYGSPGTTTIGSGQVITTFIITTTVVTIDIPLLTIGGVPYYNLNVTSTATGGGFVPEPSVSIPPVGVPLPDGKGGTTTRNLTLPPWPKVSQGPPDGPGWTMSSDPFDLPPPQPAGSPASTSSRTFTFFTPYTTSLSIAGPTVTTINFPPTPITPPDYNGTP